MAGCDALNVVMLVQLRLPQLQRTEAIRMVEEPAWKAGGGIMPLVGSTPTASATPIAPWSNGHDAWSTPRKRWFDSIRGYLVAQVRQLAERLGLNPGGCRFDSGPGHGPVGKRQTTLA